ncbi:hypothetical protein [uncultured Ferrimonas sp.]|uniref:hypothetical protein n=1 Tax=uncultured Ferrimonas sp. TaxID=432640 RepID=UPI00261E26AE|nr:hypothetical protein [uncultured Ferrimonas sp.]
MSASDESFFSVASSFDVLLDKISPEQLWLEPPQLLEAMPTAFRLMAQVTDLEHECLPLLQNMEQHAKGLAQYLKLQSSKIDLVLQQQLAQDPNAEIKAGGLRFGGSGLSVVLPNPLSPGQALAMRIFIAAEQVAVYAHGEVVECNHDELGMVAQIRFCSISEVAQEQLVRASLQVQQKQLRDRAKLRRSE